MSLKLTGCALPEIRITGNMNGEISFTFNTFTDRSDVVYDVIKTSKRLEMFFDAGTRRGNPGPSGIAIYAKVDLPEDPHFIYHLRVTEFVGERTNNEAEWLALIKTLEIVDEHAPALLELVVNSDSKLVVKQARGEWKTRSNLKSLRARAMELGKSITDRGCIITIQHVLRSENAEADRLVTELLDEHTGRKRGY